MKVFDLPIVVKKKDDGSFTVAVRLADDTVVVKSLERPAVEQLATALEKLLKEQK